MQFVEFAAKRSTESAANSSDSGDVDEERKNRMAPRDLQDSNDELVFTGERFIPHQTDPLLALEHYHRYCLASRFARKKRVVDFACGEGYGSAFLSKIAQSVVGIDIDDAAVEHARKKYAACPNLTFETGSCDHTPSQTGFDLAVSFELLEHLDSDKQSRFLENVRRVLKEDGLFLVSSPERIEYAETYQTANEYHKHEMTIPELTEFLGRYFKHIHLCAQRVLTLSTIWQLSDWRQLPFGLHARKDLLEEIPAGHSFSQPLYAVAVCSNKPIPADIIAESNSFYLDATSSDQTKTFSRWAQELNKEASRSRELLAGLHQQLNERATWAADLKNRIKIQDESIDSMLKQLETLQIELESRTEWVRSLEQKFSDRTEWALSLEAEAAKERAHANEANEELQRIRKEASASFLYRVLAKLGMIPNIRG
jgi:O-antigen biosynthesis protein